MEIEESSSHLFGTTNIFLPSEVSTFYVAMHTMLWSRAGCITRCGRCPDTCWSSLLFCGMNVGEVDIIISMVRVGLCSYNYCSGYPQCIYTFALFVCTY